MSRLPELRYVLILTGVLLLLAPTAQAHATADDGYVWTMETQLQLENVGSDPMRHIRVRLPLVAEVTGYGEVVDEEFNVEKKEVLEREEGGRKGSFLIPQLEPGESATLTLTYTIDPEGALSAAPDDEETGSLINAVEDDEISAAARSATRGMEERDARFSALQRFTHSHIDYNLDSPWRNGDAAQALKKAEGVCEDYALLLVALANSVNVPARTVYGYVGFDGGENWTRHTWVEYLSDNGEWIPADPTFSASPGLNDNIDYVAQWYEDTGARVSHVGGRVSGQMSENIERVRLEDRESIAP